MPLFDSDETASDDDALARAFLDFWGESSLRGASCVSPSAALRFARLCRWLAVSGSALEVVWHRTNDAAFAGIAQTGLEVPDGALVKVRRGSRYGPGIYATDDCAMGCAKYGRVALLCLALAGARTQVASPADATRLPISPLPCSVRAPSSVVYRHSAQVLAMARVEACPVMLQSAREVVEKCVTLVTARFPRLRFTAEEAPWKLSAGPPLTPTGEAEARSRVLLGVGRREIELLQLYESDRFKTRALTPDEKVRSKSAWPQACDVWEIRAACGLTVRVVLPPEYPFVAPHLAVVEPKVRPGAALVSSRGAVNFLPSHGLSSWSPALLLKEILLRLISAWEQGRADGSLVVRDRAGRYTATESALSLLDRPGGATRAAALAPAPARAESDA